MIFNLDRCKLGWTTETVLALSTGQWAVGVGNFNKHFNEYVSILIKENRMGNRKKTEMG